MSLKINEKWGYPFILVGLFLIAMAIWNTIWIGVFVGVGVFSLADSIYCRVIKYKREREGVKQK